MSVFFKFGFLALFLFLFGAVNCQKTESEAYVTLLYGDEFVLGVRVLGKSIRDTGSKKDMVVLVSDGVSDYAKELLQADGWIVESISLLVNPNQIRPTRFWGVYTKLKIFNMTKYKKVVYLDADTIVVKSVEDLFQCSKFCANLKHSERLNSGVMVVEPSAALFKDMMSKVRSLPSYTGGDQGFLNSYYADFPNAHLFEPELSPEARRRRPAPKMERLSTLYNADVGLYMLANKWMVDEKELRVIHYTLGPLKPWDWWTSWLLKPVDIWQNVREQLEESLPGTKGGRNPKEQLLIRILFALPVCALLFCYYRSCLKLKEFGRNSFCEYTRRIYYKALSVPVTSSSVIHSNQQFGNGANSKTPPYLGPVSVCFCFASMMLSLAIAFIVVPRQATPWSGLLLTYEWTFTMFALIFGSYLHFVRHWGRSTTETHHVDSSDDDDSHKGMRNTSSCDSTTVYYGAGAALLAILAPSMPIFLGISALFARLGIMVAGGIVFASFMTYASEHLAIRFYLRGMEDRDRSRSVCFL